MSPPLATDKVELQDNGELEGDPVLLPWSHLLLRTRDTRLEEQEGRSFLATTRQFEASLGYNGTLSEIPRAEAPRPWPAPTFQVQSVALGQLQHIVAGSASHRDAPAGAVHEHHVHPADKRRSGGGAWGADAGTVCRRGVGGRREEREPVPGGRTHAGRGCSGPPDWSSAAR